MGANIQCCPRLSGARHPASRHLCHQLVASLAQHHRRGLAWGGGHLFAADPRDTVSARPSQTLQVHICWGFGASPLGCQAKETPSQAPDPQALPSTCSSPAFPPPELTALPFSRSDHKPWHHGRPFPSSHVPASPRSTGSSRGACSAPLLPPPAGTAAGLIPKQLGSMPAALLLTLLALCRPQSPVLSPVPRPPNPATPLPSLLASAPSLSWERANLPWASQEFPTVPVPFCMSAPTSLLRERGQVKDLA